MLGIVFSIIFLFAIGFVTYVYYKRYIEPELASELASEQKTKVHAHPATPLSEIQSHDEEEVFHVALPKVGYDDASAVCKQQGAKLASYDQLLHAYQHGSEFCSHGWSKDQLALYPTQKKTWKRIQNAEDPEKREMCGHYGVNGGKFPKDFKFGVNCWGIKPIKDGKYKHTPLPKKKKEQKEELKRFDDLVVVPFSRKQWSRDGSEPSKV